VQVRAGNHVSSAARPWRVIDEEELTVFLCLIIQKGVVRKNGGKAIIKDKRMCTYCCQGYKAGHRFQLTTFISTIAMISLTEPQGEQAIPWAILGSVFPLMKV